jgi:nucleotide-binding universal stress UspA family protein
MAAQLFESVIVAFDGSSQADDALALGRLLSSIESSEIVLAYVGGHQPPFERQSREYGQLRRRKVDAVFEPALSQLAGRDRVAVASIDSSSAARGLHDLAVEHAKSGRASVLAIGSTHRSTVGRVLLGSVGELLIAGCPCPIAVAPKGFARQEPSSITRIVAGFDGSRESRAALEVGHGIARTTGAEIQVVAVEHRPAHSRRDRGDAPAQDRETLQALLDQALLELGGSVAGTVVDGEPSERLAQAAADADLLVLGARGFGPHQHVFVGSVSSKLVRTSPGPVLVLPRPLLNDAAVKSG